MRILFFCLSTFFKSITLLQIGRSNAVVEEAEILEDAKAPRYDHEWLLLAAAVDRIMMILFGIVMIISFFVYMP